MTTKSICDMTEDEKFSERVRLQWELDTDGTLHQQFTNFETFVAARYATRLAHVRFLRQRGVTEDERQGYTQEYRASSARQEEFTDVEAYVGFRAAEERMLVGTGGR